MKEAEGVKKPVPAKSETGLKSSSTQKFNDGCGGYHQLPSDDALIDSFAEKLEIAVGKLSSI